MIHLLNFLINFLLLKWPHFLKINFINLIFIKNTLPDEMAKYFPKGILDPA